MFYSVIFSLFCFALTCVGAALGFVLKSKNQKLSAIINSFSAGVMISSAIFSLIVPSLSYCEILDVKKWIVLPVCFILAYFLYYVLDKNDETNLNINPKTTIVCMALHNIPEGMCIGFAFASTILMPSSVSIMSAVMVSVGIGIQNIPEGSSVAFPLISSGKTKKTAFLISSIVGFVEVPSAIIACAIGLNFLFIMPYMLAFASAVMIYVATIEILPDAIKSNRSLSAFGLFLGLTFMMLLDLAL